MLDFNSEENVSNDANQPAAPRSGPTQQNFDKNKHIMLACISATARLVCKVKHGALL